MTTQTRWTNPASMVALRAANRDRTYHAALHKVVAARQAVRIMQRWVGHPDTRKPAGMFDGYFQAAKARVEFPDASLAQLGAKLGLTKDQYSARLRRAIAYAQTLEGNA